MRNPNVMKRLISFCVHPYITYINLKKLNFPINNVESTKTKKHVVFFRLAGFGNGKNHLES